MCGNKITLNNQQINDTTSKIRKYFEIYENAYK